MDLTKFGNLQNIIASLGADPVDVELNKVLLGDGIDVDPNQVVVGETGLFYLDPRGVVTRVLLYIVNKNIGWHKGDKGKNIRNMVALKDFDNSDLVVACHKYHILNCSTLEQAHIHGWKDKYKAAKRLDGTFFYRFLDHQTVLQEVRNQPLDVCGNCLRLLNQMTDNQYIKKGFVPDNFFSLSLEGLNKGVEVNPDCPPPPNIYAPDWQDISVKYRKMKGYQCEGENCPHRDLSAKNLRQYLHCHHVDREKQHNTFFNLKSLCVYCHSKQPQHGHMQNSNHLTKYLFQIGRAIKSCPSCNKQLLTEINKTNKCPSCGGEFK